MIIIGAGYAGLLAGCINRDSVIYEANSEEECAEKHQAVFRMRSNRIAEYLGIKFKKVEVFKSIWYCEKNMSPTPDMIHMYSKKVSGTISSRSIGNIDTEIRYIPPDDFYNQLLRKSCRVRFNDPYLFPDNPAKQVISTMPLISMLKLIKDVHPQFHKYGTRFDHNPIYVTRLQVKNCNSYATVYYPSDIQKIYRATLNSDILIIESMEKLDPSDGDFGSVFNSMGIDEDDIDKELSINQINNFGKITEIDNKIRSQLILDLTLKHNIYSLGRYATWRPKIMLDDVFDDIFVIRRLIEDGGYASVLHQQDMEK